MDTPTKGFIALTSVLILSAIFLSVCISIASRAIATLSSELAYIDRDKARYNAEACAQYALREAQRTLHYKGGDHILLHEGTCDVRTVETLNETLVIGAESTVNTHTYKLQVVLDALRPDASVLSYQRVSDF